MTNSSSAGDPPCDFIAFVAQSRGIKRAGASLLVSNWLESYEPGPAALARASTPSPAKEPASGAPRSARSRYGKAA